MSYFPTIKDNISEYAEKKLVNNMSESGRVMYHILQRSKKWQDEYTFKTLESGEVWIKELKGIKFETMEQAKLYAFLYYCDKIGKEFNVG